MGLIGYARNALSIEVEDSGDEIRCVEQLSGVSPRQLALAEHETDTLQSELHWLRRVVHRPDLNQVLTLDVPHR